MKTYLISAFVFSVLVLTSCSKDKDEGPDTRAQFIGSYMVEERFTDDDEIIDTYNLQIEAGDGSQDLKIHNFADYMLVPVAGKTNGQKFTIPNQPFTEGALTVTISGQGEVNGNTLEFTYRRILDNSSSGFHDDTEYRCIATKQ